MRRPVALAIALLAAAPAAARPAEQRCGWLANPTPANFYLTDRDGEWTIGEQGGYEAAGIDRLPADRPRGRWIVTNVGDYGYGCACLTVTTDRAVMRVTRVLGGRSVPLKQCRADRRLKRP